MLVQAARTRQEKPPETQADKQLHEEEDILKHVTQKTALKTVKELAKVCLYFHKAEGPFTTHFTTPP